jgi:excisionase family DNA binding protein
MNDNLTPLYVRLSADPSLRLERAVSVSGKSKRQLVEDAVREHLTDDGLVVGRLTLREDTPEVLTLTEAASLLRVDEDELREAAQSGDLPGRQIAGQWRFSSTALMAWLRQADASEIA